MGSRLVHKLEKDLVFNATLITHHIEKLKIKFLLNTNNFTNNDQSYFRFAFINKSIYVAKRKLRNCIRRRLK